MTRRLRFFPVMVASFATTIAFTLPFGARAAEPVSVPFEIVRAGDGAMNCTALAAEINGLAVPQTAAPARPKKKGGLGFFRVVASAMPFAGAMGSVGGGLLSSAAGAASSAAEAGAASSATDEGTASLREAVAGGSPRQQRRERLTALFDTKGC